MLKRLLCIICVLMVSLFVMSGCSSSESVKIDTPNIADSGDTNKTKGQEGSEILIGSASVLSGSASFLGTQLTFGSKVYIDKVNAEGGVNGKKLKFITRDDKYEPATTVTETKKLIEEDKVFTLFDYVGTPTSKEIMSLINEKKMPLLGLFTGAEFLRNPFQPYVFNVRASYYQEAQTIVDKALGDGKKDISVFYQDDAFGLAVLQGTNIALSKVNSKPKELATYKRNEAITQEAVDKIVASKPQAVVMVGTYSQLALFVGKCVEKGLKDTDFYTVSFVGTEAYAEELKKLSPEASKNTYVSQVVPDPKNETVPVVKEFKDALAKGSYPDAPNYVSLEGYINAKVLVEALKRAGKDLTRESYMKALEGMSGYDPGSQIKVGISNSNHQMFNKVFMSKFEEGSFIVKN